MMATRLALRSEESGGVPVRQRKRAIASVLAAMTLVVLDAAIVNIALPTIGRSLGVTPSAAMRVVTAYQLGVVVALLPAGVLGESIGYRRVFVSGAVLFTGASLLCALAPSLYWLIAARFLQGLGGAGIMALGVALLRFIVPNDRLGAAIGWNAMTVALSSAAGPTLGAAVLSVASWPWLFLVNLPIGAGVLVAARSLPLVEGTGEPVDKVAVALNAFTFVLLVLGAELAPQRPAFTPLLFFGAVGAGIALVRREAGHIAPLIPLDLLGRRSFRLSVIASILCFTGQTAALVVLPFHLRDSMGLSVAATGLCMTPWPLAVAVAGPIAGRLANRVPTAWLCLSGGIFLAAGLASAALVPFHAQWFAIGICTMLCGLGFGLFNVPNNRNMFLSAPRARSGAAGGLQGMARLTGQTSGAVLATLLFSLFPPEIAPRIGLTMAAALTLAAGAASIGRAGVSG